MATVSSSLSHTSQIHIQCYKIILQGLGLIINGLSTVQYQCRRGVQSLHTDVSWDGMKVGKRLSLPISQSLSAPSSPTAVPPSAPDHWDLQAQAGTQEDDASTKQ